MLPLLADERWNERDAGLIARIHKHVIELLVADGRPDGFRCVLAQDSERQLVDVGDLDVTFGFGPGQVPERIVNADSGGRFRLAGIPGAPLRMRAWKVPNLAMSKEAAIFATGLTKELEAEWFENADGSDLPIPS